MGLKHVLDYEGRVWKQTDHVKLKYIGKGEWRGEIVYFLSANIARVAWYYPKHHTSTEFLTHLERIQPLWHSTEQRN